MEKNSDGSWNLAWAVKDYKRSTDDYNYLGPELTRPPNILRKTLDYLIDNILGIELKNPEFVPFY